MADEQVVETSVDPAQEPTGDTVLDGGSENKEHFLSEEMRGNEALSGFDNAESLAKAYLDASKPVETPDADKYEFSLEDVKPELLESLSSDLGKTANELGLTQEQAQGVLKHFMEKGVQTDQLIEKAVTDDREAALKTLKTDWGKNYDKNTELMKKAVKTFADDDTTKFLKENKLADHPGIAKLFYEIGSKMSEGAFVVGEPDPGSKPNLGPDGSRVISFKK